MFADTFTSIDVCLRQWRYYAKEARKTSINTSSFVILDNLVAPVCLDATASNNYLWELLGKENAKVIEIPRNARSYVGVELKVALHAGRGGVGKGGMSAKASGRSRRLIAHLNKKIDAHEDILIVSHKKLKPTIIEALDVDPEAPIQADGLPEWFRLQSGARVYLNHWWALDGLNTYQHCSQVVIFGLPYMDDVWAFNMVFALQGYKPDLLSSPEFKSHAGLARL
jgi:hypothetical protein